jgi:uncharacterized membrane protein
VTINPYQAPTSATADVPPAVDDSGFTGEIARLPAGAGLTWLSEGFELFKAGAGMWIAIALLYFVFGFAANFIPFIGGIAWSVLQPILIGGLMIGCDVLRRGGALNINHLFEGFNRNGGQLALVGAIYIGAILAVVVVLGIGAAIAVPTLGADFLRDLGGQDPTLSIMFVLLIVLVSLAVSLPLLMAVWFAPALVILHDVPAVDAMRRSFTGCLRNVVPFLLYGVASLVLAIIATLPIMLGWLVLGPVVIASAYAGYRGIYCAN